MDHIDGNFLNDQDTNLRFACPNCHSLTPTYCRSKSGAEKHIKKIYKARERISLAEESRRNKECKKRMKAKECALHTRRYSNGTCRGCAYERGSRITKILWPSIPELYKMIEATSYVAVGKKLGVSDNGVRKHIRKNLRGGEGKRHTLLVESQ